MLPSDLIEAIVDSTKEVEGIEDVLRYEPTPQGVICTTAWVDLESLVQASLSIEDFWEAEATIRITVAVPQDRGSKLAAWDLAYAVASYLRHQRWGNLRTEPAELVTIDRAVLADFEGDLDAVEIELSQRVYFPAMNPESQGNWITNPSTVWVSVEPYVGPDHIDDYEKVSEYP